MSDDDTLEDGRWVTVRGIQRWQTTAGSLDPRGRTMYRELLAERYAEPLWFAKPAHDVRQAGDTELACLRRCRAAVADDVQTREREAS